MKEQVAALCWVLGRHVTDEEMNVEKEEKKKTESGRQSMGNREGGMEIFPISSTCVVVRKLISTVDSRMSDLVLGPPAVC